MVQVTIEEAEIRMSELIGQALAGEDVVIAIGTEPTVRMVPLAEKPEANGGRGR